MNENLTSILITVVTLMFSGGAWKFYEFLVKNKRTLIHESMEVEEQLFLLEDGKGCSRWILFQIF